MQVFIAANDSPGRREVSRLLKPNWSCTRSRPFRLQHCVADIQFKTWTDRARRLCRSRVRIAFYKAQLTGHESGSRFLILSVAVRKPYEPAQGSRRDLPDRLAATRLVLDAGLRAQFSQRSRQFVRKHFAVEQMVDCIYHLYLKLAAERGLPGT